VDRAGAPAAGDEAAGSVPTDPSADTGTSLPADEVRSSGDRPRLAASRVFRWIQMAALAVIALAWFSLTLDTGLSMRDEGYLLHMGAQVAHGQVPHRDFVEAYGPGVFSTTAVLLEAAQYEIVGLRMGLAVIKTLAVLLTFGILSRLTPGWVAFAGSLFATVYWGRASLNLNAPHAALYTIPIGLLASLLMLRALTIPTRGAHLLVGLAAGSALLFKQSVGAMSAVGLGLALAALAVLQPPSDERPDEPFTPVPVLLGLWALAAGAIVLPTAPFMSARDYAIHLLPIHLAMGVVAMGVHRRSPRVRLRWILEERLLPYAGGVALSVAPVVALYAAWGALPDMLYDMFVFPRTLRNYYLPVALPRPAYALLGLGFSALMAGGLLGLARRRRIAGATLLAGGAAFGVALGLIGRAVPTGRLPIELWRASALFDWILPALLVIAATGLLADDIRRKGWSAASSGLLVLTFHQAFLCFQIFPRAGHNVWIVQGAMLPLVALLAYRAWSATIRCEMGFGRRLAAGVLCVALPFWLAAPLAERVLAQELRPGPERAVDLPHAQGLKMDWKDWRRQQIGAAQKLIRHLAMTSQPDTPLLLIGNEQMIYFASDRPHLVPSREFLLYSAASGMIPDSEIYRLGDADIARRLETAADVRVVIAGDTSARRLLGLLPEVELVIAGQFQIDERIGPYVVWRPSLTRGPAATR
jgi:hypothetical protein